MSAALAATPRAAFLPEAFRKDAEADRPVPIGHGQTNSQPRTVEAMLRLLEIRPGDRVLDVGAGSGWTTALLAYLTGPSGSVTGVELLPDLAARGEASIRRTPMDWASIRLARPGVLGVPEEAPYDAILVSAEARALPSALLAQLADPGRLVLPVRGTMTLVVRRDGLDSTSTHGSYRFVPLIE